MIVHWNHSGGRAISKTTIIISHVESPPLTDIMGLAGGPREAVTPYSKWLLHLDCITETPPRPLGDDWNF